MQLDPSSISMERSSGHAPRSVRVLGVRVHDISAPEIVEYVTEVCAAGRKAIVSYVNAHAMEIAGDQTWFREFLNQSDLLFCDGFGVSLASALLGQGWLHRNTPPDWMDELMAAAVHDDLSLFFLGTHQEIVEIAADVFRSRFPGLKIAGCHHGYFDKTKTSSENIAVLQDINLRHPDILIVGFGMPIQEKWIQENWADLDVHVAVPVGAMFDFVAGETYRAPRWVTDHGLEWLSRLVVEPGRLWRRYVIGIPVFFWRVLLQRMGWLHVA